MHKNPDTLESGRAAREGALATRGGQRWSARGRRRQRARHCANGTRTAAGSGREAGRRWRPGRRTGRPWPARRRSRRSGRRARVPTRQGRARTGWARRWGGAGQRTGAWSNGVEGGTRPGGARHPAARPRALCACPPARWERTQGRGGPAQATAGSAEGSTRGRRPVPLWARGAGAQIAERTGALPETVRPKGGPHGRGWGRHGRWWRRRFLPAAARGRAGRGPVPGPSPQEPQVREATRG